MTAYIYVWQRAELYKSDYTSYPCYPGKNLHKTQQTSQNANHSQFYSTWRRLIEHSIAHDVMEPSLQTLSGDVIRIQMMTFLGFHPWKILIEYFNSLCAIFDHDTTGTRAPSNLHSPTTMQVSSFSREKAGHEGERFPSPSHISSRALLARIEERLRSFLWSYGHFSSVELQLLSVIARVFFSQPSVIFFLLLSVL